VVVVVVVVVAAAAAAAAAVVVVVVAVGADQRQPSRLLREHRLRLGNGWRLRMHRRGRGKTKRRG